jgi:hypothetical protein
LPVRGCHGAQIIGYPCRCLVFPPRQLPFAGPLSSWQAMQTVAWCCLRAPHTHRSWDRHAGQRRWRLDGLNSRPHSAQIRVFMAAFYIENWFMCFFEENKSTNTELTN